MSELQRMQENERLAVLQAIEMAEKRPPPSVSGIFTDVYAEVPRHLKEQERQLHEHMAKYSERYGTTHHHGP
jgi:2-oxoisovalerate dehydrogenase E1 component alpha subunit